MDKFKPLARAIFSSKSKKKGLVTQAWNFFCNLLADAAYDSLTLDETLKKVFGPKRYLFDVPHVPLASRVALATSHIEMNGLLCLLTNYRHFRKGNGPNYYETLLPNTLEHEPLLWQA